MITIYKYPIAHTDEQVLTLPSGSQIISVAKQYNNVVIYAMVNPTELLMDSYHVIILGTGTPIEWKILDYKFLGTLAFSNGDLMFHYFVKLVSEA